LQSAQRLRDAVLKALQKMHAVLSPEQRQKLAMLIRTGRCRSRFLAYRRPVILYNRYEITGRGNGLETASDGERASRLVLVD